MDPHRTRASQRVYDDYGALVEALGGSPEIDSVTTVTSVDDLYVGWVTGKSG